jgi:hypothetical protein
MSMSYNQHRLVLGVFLLFCLVATANYYLELNLFGRLDTGAYAFSVVLLVVYCFMLASIRKGNKERETADRDSTRPVFSLVPERHRIYGTFWCCRWMDILRPARRGRSALTRPPGGL